MKLSPAQKIKQIIIRDALQRELFDPAEIDRVFDDHYEDLYDAKSDWRSGEYETEIPSESDRHYESKSVAAQMMDGSYVGWTYWYGGGKHGAPSTIEWIEDAYEVEMTEETRVVKVFKKVEHVS